MNTGSRCSGVAHVDAIGGAVEVYLDILALMVDPEHIDGDIHCGAVRKGQFTLHHTIVATAVVTLRSIVWCGAGADSN